MPASAAFLLGILGGRLGIAAALCTIGVAIGLSLLVRNVSRSLLAGTVVALTLGIAESALAGHAATPISDPRTSRFWAVVTAVDRVEDGRVDVTLRLDDGSRALASAALPVPPIGTRLLLRGRRERFDEPRNPGEPSPRELETERGNAWRIARAEVLRRAPVDERDPSLWFARFRAWGSAQLHRDLGEPDATILAGAMWGEKGALPPELHAEFQDTGTVHVLVTAGLHLGVVAACAYAVLAWLGCGRIPASLVTIAVVWTYAAFSGAHLPSMRAATMVSFFLVARAAGRDAFSWNALAAAAIVVAAARPASVGSLSFSLSFGCVAAILAFAEPIARGVARIGIPHALAEMVGVACAAQLGTWPLTAAAFLVIAPYAPLANLAIVPVVGIAMLGGFLELACSPFALVARPVANVEHVLLDWIVTTVRCTSGLPFAHLVATPAPPWIIVTYAVALVAAAVALRRERRTLGVAAIVVASVLCLWPPRAARHDLTITLIDVGQADSILIRTPAGHAFLVDGGGRLERGRQAAGTSLAENVDERTVVPFLIRDGIHHVDAVLLSHPHGDHAGLAPVLRTLGADAFADSGQRYGGFAYNDALAVAASKKIAMREPRAGDVWRTDDGVTLRFYNPMLPFISGTRNDINENSLVFRLEYGRFSMLFMGDAGAVTEQRLLSSGVDLRSTVLKVGHHGSAYGSSPAFIAAVSPEVAAISVGRNNLFGHPAFSTLETLATQGAHVYRTDRNGAIRVKSDGIRTSVAAMYDDLPSPVLRGSLAQ